MLFAKDIKESTGGKYLTVGIHTACNVVDMQLGQGYAEFLYEKDGKTANKRIFYPDINRITLKEGETKESAYLAAVMSELAHVKKHMKIFLDPEEVENFSAPDIETFCYKAMNLMNMKFRDKKVNLKLIYDKDGQWARFGTFPDYIEEYKEGVPCGLSYTKWELDNRTTKKTPAAVASTDTTLLY